MRLIVEPAQLRDPTNEFDEGHDDKVLQIGSLIGEVGQDVIANVNALRDGEVVPVGSDELREGIGGDNASVLRRGVVEDILALRDVVGGGGEGEEARLGLGSCDGFSILANGRRAHVQGFAQGFHLGQLLSVHCIMCGAWCVALGLAWLGLAPNESITGGYL